MQSLGFPGSQLPISFFQVISLQSQEKTKYISVFRRQKSLFKEREIRGQSSEKAVRELDFLIKIGRAHV